MVILISGGCKNGKTSLAEKIINKMSCGKNMYYVATMVPYDNEDIKRIKNHIEERKDYNFSTVEINNTIDKLIDLKGYFLFDSITAYLLNHIIAQNNELNDENYENNKISDLSYDDDNIYKKISSEFKTLIEDKNKNIVFVSDYIYSDAINYDEFTNFYIKNLSFLERFVAKYADVVMEISASNIVYYKGEENVKKYMDFI